MEDLKAVQGTADGLCGFYALVNFILKTAPPEEEGGRSSKQEAFRYLAEAAERLQLLTPIKLVGGYEWHELLEIFNLDAARRHTGYKAYPIKLVKSKQQDMSGLKLVLKIIEHGGAAVILVQGGSHWVLAYDQDGKRLRIVDPTHGEVPTSLDRVANMAAGLAIFPESSAIIEVLDA